MLVSNLAWLPSGLYSLSLFHRCTCVPVSLTSLFLSLVYPSLSIFYLIYPSLSLVYPSLFVFHMSSVSLTGLLNLSLSQHTLSHVPISLISIFLLLVYLTLSISLSIYPSHSLVYPSLSLFLVIGLSLTSVPHLSLLHFLSVHTLVNPFLSHLYFCYYFIRLYSSLLLMYPSPSLVYPSLFLLHYSPSLSYYFTISSSLTHFSLLISLSLSNQQTSVLVSLSLTHKLIYLFFTLSHTCSHISHSLYFINSFPSLSISIIILVLFLSHSSTYNVIFGTRQKKYLSKI